MVLSTDILFISHGGGPLPLLGDPDHRELVQHLEGLASRLQKPDAILVISAHWEASVPTVTAAARPELIYDYYGFPPESYEITYPCTGKPSLAAKVTQALRQAGLNAIEDEERGLDHGVFVPLKIMYPKADIPVVQLSLLDSLDPEIHIAMGKALKNLDDGHLMVLGSGFSFHNLRALFDSDPTTKAARNREFEEWLLKTCVDNALSEKERYRRLVEWDKAPHARYCHPREEHLLPLHVCYGMAGKPSEEHISTTIMNTQSGMFHWSIR